MRWSLLLAIAVFAMACGSDSTETPAATMTAAPNGTATAGSTPTAEPTGRRLPLGTPTPTPTLVNGPATPAPPPSSATLRSRAEAFALARTDARFEITYEFTLPSFRDVCDYSAWVGGLMGEAGVLRAFNGFGDDEPLVWEVQLVETTGNQGMVVESVSTASGQGLGLETRTWAWRDGEWWLDEPPEEMCNL